MNEIYDIYCSDLNSLRPAKKLGTYESTLTKDYNLYFIKLNILFNKTLSTVYENKLFLVKKHNLLINIGQTIEEAQDLYYLN